MKKPKETFEEQVGNFMKDVFHNKIDLSENAPLDEVDDEIQVSSIGSILVIKGLDLVDDDEPFDYGHTFTYQELVKAIDMALNGNTKGQILKHITDKKQ